LFKQIVYFEKTLIQINLIFPKTQTETETVAGSIGYLNLPGGQSQRQSSNAVKALNG